MRWLIALGLAACGRSEAPQSAAPLATSGDASRLAADAAVTITVDAAAPSVIPAEARELLVVITDDWKATRATLRRYRRDGATWQLAGTPWDGVVGYGGTGWGAGLHGAGPPTGRSGPTKVEGDGKSPAGVFALNDLFGYAKAPPAGTKLAYTPAGTWQCIDDPRSRFYNRIIDNTPRDWSSSEPMRRGDMQYEWAVEIGHNPDRTPRAGSCVFLHVWTGPGEPTTGCTAMAEPIMRDLIATLDPSAVFVLLPKAEYAALAPAWGLPQ